MTPLRLTCKEVEALGGHTPGPWIAKEYARHDASVVVAETDADKHEDPGAVIVSETSAADARLIAAAPDLRADLLTLHAEVERLRAERERLLAWLSRIEGGDNPTAHADTLRHWAWSAGMGGEP